MCRRGRSPRGSGTGQGAKSGCVCVGGTWMHHHSRARGCRSCWQMTASGCSGWRKASADGPQEALYLQSSDEGPLPHIFPMSSFPFLASWWTLGILYPDAVQPLGERRSAPNWCPEGQSARDALLAELVWGCCPLLSPCSIAVLLQAPPSPPPRSTPSFIPVKRLVCKLGHLAQDSQIKSGFIIFFF